MPMVSARRGRERDSWPPVARETRHVATHVLILTRRVGETLMIGDQVTVTVLGVKGNQVRIGINAPKDVTVHREEIYQRIRKDDDPEAAADAAGDGSAAQGDPD